MKNPLKFVWAILGFICLGLGTIGVILPILPTVPFYVVTVLCFAKSSKRLHQWFTNSKLYKKHLESLVNKRGMTMKAKISVIAMASTMLGIGFLLMSKVPVGRVCITIVWLFHLYFFFVIVKTLPNELIKPEQQEER
ncbi:MAG: YbaN family protein [Clostridiales bacterium]|nr:YbaN family protein [Clostridiales bacterium]